MAGIYNPHGIGKMLFALFAGITEAEREFIRERTMEGLAIAEAKGHRGGGPPPSARTTSPSPSARRAKGEPVPSIAALLGVGRSTLYRTLEQYDTGPDALASESDIHPLGTRPQETVRIWGRSST